MLMTPQQAAEQVRLRITDPLERCIAELAENAAYERLQSIDLAVEPNQDVAEVLLKDSPLRREWAALYRLAEVKNELGELEYEVYVDVTAEPDQESEVLVGVLKVRVGGCVERVRVVLDCDLGVEEVAGRKVMRFVGRVCR